MTAKRTNAANAAQGRGVLTLWAVAPPIRFTLTDDEVSIAYSVHGEGPPLVLVRGWISHLDLQWMFPDYRIFMEALGRHFTVIRYDMRGNGLSERDCAHRLSLDDLTLDLFALVDALKIDSAVFLATCYGGPILARFASLAPATLFDRVIFDGTFARGEELATPAMRESIMSTVKLLDSAPGAAATMLRYYTDPSETPSSAPDHQQRLMNFGRDSINADVAAALYGLSFTLDVSKDLINLTAPTLVTHRRQSKAVPVEFGRKIAALVPNATFVSQDGSQTNPWDRDATTTLQAMGDFLGVGLADSYVPRNSARPTVVLFSDIVESTSTTSRLGDADSHAVNRRFHAVSKEALEGRGGRFIKSLGDGVMAEFPSVSQAIGCAIDMQHAFGEIPVRIGINAGEPVSVDDDLHGIVVTTAARVCSEGGAGEIVVSNVVRELAVGKGFVFESIGEHQLKGIGDVTLYKVAY